MAETVFIVLIAVATLVLMVPAALAGHWLGYNLARRWGETFNGRPSSAEVARRLIQLERNRSERGG